MARNKEVYKSYQRAYSRLPKRKRQLKAYQQSPKGKGVAARAGKKCRQDKRDVIQLLKDAPCVDCRNSYPACAMDFDHVRGKKLFDLSHAVTRSPELIVQELEKCDLVCANCHRIRTEKRRNGRH